MKLSSKRILLSLMLVSSSAGLFAQKLEKAKDLLERKKYPEAQAEIDGVLAQEKNNSQRQHDAGNFLCK